MRHVTGVSEMWHVTEVWPRCGVTGVSEVRHAIEVWQRRDMCLRYV